VIVADLASLELAATRLGDRDLLQSPRELGAWLDARGLSGPELTLRLADFRRLRGAIRGALAATVEDRPLPADAVEALNAASAASPTHRRLAVDPVRVDQDEDGPPATRVIAAIARSAIEILGGPDRDRLRVCPAPGCGRFFLASRPDRTWCSPSCGNRVRVARHHERRRRPPTLRA
jgi:predicted RNA-binding Zn ribbon-like protein